MKKKFVVRLMGGLGNQFFQYAFAIALEEYCTTNNIKCEIKLDASSYIRDYERTNQIKLFDISLPFVSKLEEYYYEMRYKLASRKIMQYPQYSNEKELFICQGFADFIDRKWKHNYLVGYWQNVHYFDNTKSILREAFSYAYFEEIVHKDSAVYKLMNDIACSDSVSIHVRRGDYLSNKYNKNYIIQGLDYYKAAVQKIIEYIEKPQFFIFSDDIEWCKNELSVLLDRDKMEFSFVSDVIKLDACVEFELMKNCKHFIIGNSTFSWWAAWLSEYSDGIKIAPKGWLHNEVLQQRIVPALLSDFELI